MGKEINILILSAGTRNKVVQAFKKELQGIGRVIAADCSPLGPAIYDADAAYIVPPIREEGYIDRILEICEKERISGVFSLIDPELSLLAANRERFEEIGVVPVVSSYELCEISLNKLRMNEFLKGSAFGAAACWTDPEEFLGAAARGEASFPVFVKPVCGSASLNISRVETEEELRVLFARHEGLMIQELLTGQEYGADVYIDLISGKCTHIFLKKKLRMRAGETDKSVSVQNPELFGLLSDFAQKAGFRGMIDVDLFEQDGRWILSEVNPRFGGGYPHAYACGVNFPAALIRNLQGLENPAQIGNYRENVYMMKYNEICIREASELYE